MSLKLRVFIYFCEECLVLFNIVQFSNDPCNGTSSDVGVCYTQAECIERGGSPASPCAAGFGVCCVCKSEDKMKVCGDLLFSQGLGSGGGEEGQDGEDLLLQQLGLA